MVDHVTAKNMAESIIADADANGSVADAPWARPLAAAYLEDHAEVERLRGEVERLRAEVDRQKDLAQLADDASEDAYDAGYKEGKRSWDERAIRRLNEMRASLRRVTGAVIALTNAMPDQVTVPIGTFRDLADALDEARALLTKGENDDAG